VRPSTSMEKILKRRGRREKPLENAKAHPRLRLAEYIRASVFFFAIFALALRALRFRLLMQSGNS